LISCWFKAKCSLCDMELPIDELIHARKQAHENKHTRGWNHKAQNKGGGNNTIGTVVWGYTLC